MQPNYPAQYPAPPAQQYPTQPAYPAPTAYPAQYPAAPQYPVAPAAPQYPAQYPVAPQYPGQYPAAAGAPAQPSAPGSLDGFYDQPSTSGGPSFKFQGKPVGTAYAGVVERPVTDADVRQQTNNAGVPQTYRDGRPKFIMVVPMLVQPSAEFPEGKAGWWVKGQARDELVRAMNEAGAPAGPPEAGALIHVTLVGQRPIPGMNPAYQYRIVYQRPTGDPAAAVAALPAPAPVQYPTAPAQYAAPPAQPVYAAPQAPVAPVPAPAAMAAVAAGQPGPVAAPAAPAGGMVGHVVVNQAPAPGLTPEQTALMARLTGASA